MLPGWRVRRWRRRRATSFLLLLMIIALTLGYCLNRADRPRAVLDSLAAEARIVTSG